MFAEIFRKNTRLLLRATQFALLNVSKREKCDGVRIDPAKGSEDMLIKYHMAHGAEMLTSFTITTVYHKLVPFCGPRFNCASPLAATPIAPVYDIGTSTDGRRCNGKRCAFAAQVVDDYHTFLWTLTAIRTNMLRLYFKLDVAGKKNTCSQLASDVDEVKRASTKLEEHIVPSLRKAAAQLDVAIVRGKGFGPDG